MNFRGIRHLKLTHVAEKPPPSQAFEQVALMTAEDNIIFNSILVFISFP